LTGAAGFDCARCKPSRLARGFKSIKKFRTAQLAVQELSGQFAPSNAAHPVGAIAVDVRLPSTILNLLD
jgi:hypothetical protein